MTNTCTAGMSMFELTALRTTRFCNAGAAVQAVIVLVSLAVNTFATGPARASTAQAATQVATAATPTVAELLDASNAEYIIASPAPAGMHHFKIAGFPISYTNLFDGVAATVWITAENQVVIAYQGTTGGENLLTDPVILIPQLLSDLAAASVVNTAAYSDSLNFAKFVIGAAKLQGYSTANIFVTGHSLGAIEAEFVASQTGLGGIGFESTGLPAKDIHGRATNFVNTAAFGDPVGSYASDIAGEQPFAPAYVAGGGKDPHYGLLVQFGSPADQVTLSQGMANWGKSLNDNAATIGNWAKLFLANHFPGVIAHDLGVTLSPYSAIVDGIGNKTAPVWNVANDTIPQFVAAAAANGLLVTP